MGPTITRPGSAMSRTNVFKDAVAPYWEICAVIPGRISLSIHRSVAHTSGQQTRDTQRHFFSSEIQDRFHLTVMSIVEFCELIHKKMTDPRLEKKHLMYYTGPSENTRFNAAFLMGSYLVTKCGMPAEEAAKCFEKSRAFRLGTISMTDKAPQGYDLDLKGCLSALEKAVALGWFQLVTSMIEERTHMCKDLNLQQIVPNVYVFNSPVSGEMLHSFFEDPFSGGGRVYGPEKFVETFHEKSITVVAQLDKVTYDTSVFTEHGVRCVDMNFEDDKAPPPHLMRRFLKLVSNHPAGSAVAVHSKRGMGRAGVIVAMYLMEEFLLTAAEAIGWLRLVRPGMVFGVQQVWLHSKEELDNRPWHLKQEIGTRRRESCIASSERRPLSPQPPTLLGSGLSSPIGIVRTPSLVNRAEKAAAEAKAPHARQLASNPRMRAVVDKMVSVSSAWGTLKARVKSGALRKKNLNSGALAPMGPPHLVPTPGKPPERKVNVHTIQIGSGDNIQTIKWTEVESADEEN